MNNTVPLDFKTNTNAGIENLIALTQKDMQHVNQLILDMAKSHVNLIPKITEYLVSSGGKRLRPMLTIAAAKLFGYANDAHIKLAACVEFMHTATLLHDDVVDESTTRRNKKTARILWGNQACVLVGDYLLGQAFRMMVEVGSLAALEILSTASAVIAEGEVKQLTAVQNININQIDYLDIIQSKTAALFSAATEIGPVLAGSTPENQRALKEFGKNLGLAFQLVDDVLDYAGSSDDMGKNVGDDLREGKITLPLLLSYERSSLNDRLFFDNLLRKTNITDDDLKSVIHIMKNSGALESTIKLAENYAEKAKKAMSCIPDNPVKSSLLETVGFCLRRFY